MSDPANNSTNLIQTIKTDLENAGDWLETKAVNTATAVWTIVKAAFELATSAQAQVVLDVFARVESDETAGKSLEQIETDMLQTATADELVILKSLGSQVIQAFIAFITASKAAQAAS